MHTAHTAQSAPWVQGNVAFIPSLFNETLAMLFEAHDYFDHEGFSEQSVLPDGLQLIFANEMSRVTMRLTSIMAWLMIRKAHFEGTIDSPRPDEHFMLQAREVCLVENRHVHGFMPPRLVSLLEESLWLYQRVDRLDSMEHRVIPSIMLPVYH